MLFFQKVLLLIANIWYSMTSTGTVLETIKEDSIQ